MAKRDKNRSFNEWENDWNNNEYEDSKKMKQNERRKTELINIMLLKNGLKKNETRHPRRYYFDE